MIKYAAIVECSYYEQDPYDSHAPGSIVKYHSLKEFKDRREMELWVERQVKTKLSSPIYRIIQFEELKVTTEVKINFGTLE